MLRFEEALAQVLETAPRLESETVPLAEAAGRTLAEALRTTAPIPAFDYSAMDGYAVRSSDLATAPIELPVVGESRTGRSAEPLEPGAACRIFTGAMIPPGADAVVMQEDVTRIAARARFDIRPSPGQHIRRAGEDLGVGALALAAGTRLGPFQLGLAAALDRGSVVARRRPRVVILSTGDELRPPGSTPRPGSIPETNSFVVAALARRALADVRSHEVAPDDPEQTRRRIADALESADVLVTIGGVSVGDHDVVRPALEAAGATLSFWKVAIKPGKPLVLGRRDGTVILGLPGNPASAQVTFALFGLPLLRQMQGDTHPTPAPIPMTLTNPLTQKPGRRGFYRATTSGTRVTPLSAQSSGATTSMAWADALVTLPETSEGAAAGDRVDVYRFEEL